MTLYCGIDLHSNNHVVCVIDDKDQRILEKKLDNDPELTLRTLSQYKKRLKAIAVESTFNWYWLVDAFHLAHLMRLGIFIQRKSADYAIYCASAYSWYRIAAVTWP